LGYVSAETGVPRIEVPIPAKMSEITRIVVITFLPPVVSAPIRWVAAFWKAIKAGRRWRVYE
jgi:hypothetical protein